MSVFVGKLSSSGEKNMHIILNPKPRVQGGGMHELR
jgi:hypothetical protein